MTAPQAWLLLLAPLLLLVVRYSLVAKRARKRRRQQLDHDLPPSPPALPILGHLHLLGSLPHVSLSTLAVKHGYDLMLLRLGALPVIVVTSPRAAEAVLRTHDHVFASRPHSLVAEVVLYGPSNVGFSPYGEHWRQIRRLFTTHLLSAKKVRSFRLAREEEVGMVMVHIREAAATGTAVDMSELINWFMNDLVCRTVMGKSFRSEGRNKLLQKLIADTSPLLAGFNVEEFFPFLARLGVLSKVVRAKFERVRQRWDDLLDRLIQEHESKSASDPKDGDDFVHVLLSVREEYELTKDHMKAVLLDVFFAGIDTSASVLDCAMAELLRRPSVMAKLQTELRSSVPEGQGFVSEADLTDAAYLRAVIKESLRLHPAAPLLVPHFSMASCDVDGYLIPAGVRVLINVWAMGRDARFWEDPLEFMPERFIDGGSATGVDFKGNDFQFLPFGSGRRMCGGLNLALATMELLLANLVYCFDWEMPEGKGRHDIDMSEAFGVVVHRKEKLLLVPKLHV
ncbi:hypothetical protein PR202_ga19786 [Eleusine coracana subsp. coracana]|uniref:Uncharacterized protein n=1 Tax=Eleusine coracana subsp. coracana TaxID=191504 RepID=A0AAV5CWH4_ELECO|nr:hypothetical protein PR202_ga19786 [Eleusine coracana subsp. coracana]